MRPFAIALSMLLLFASCKKENNVTGCTEPNLGNNCITDSVTLSTAIVGKWCWVERSVWGQTSTPCSLNHTEQLYLEFFTNGTLYDQIDNSCPLIGGYHINTVGYMQAYLDTVYHNPAHNGQVSICNNYLIIDNSPVDGPCDVYIRE